MKIMTDFELNLTSILTEKQWFLGEKSADLNWIDFEAVFGSIFKSILEPELACFAFLKADWLDLQNLNIQKPVPEVDDFYV